MKIPIAIMGGMLGAAGGYGTAVVFSVGEMSAFTAIATAVFGSVILSAAFSGVYLAFTGKKGK